MDDAELERARQFYMQRRYGEAEAIYRRAVVEQPGVAENHFNLGTALKGQKRHAEAIEAFGRALALRPGFVECLNNLANSLRESHRVDEAIEVYQRAVTANPDFAAAWNNLGMALKDTGRLREAIAAFERAMELSPGHRAPGSNRLQTIHFDSRFGAKEILSATREWAEKFVPGGGADLGYSVDRSEGRRLRVGYVSPYFRRHCQALFTSALLPNHDRGKFEIYCYSDTDHVDGVTERLKKSADVWRETGGLTDERLAAAVREDRIDILVDLTMHMAMNRLGVFGRKPAPVQVTWLAYPGTTGVGAMDYRLTDARLDPPGAGDGMYVEKSVRLADSFWCYDARGMELGDGELPAVSELPARRNGRVTFGCLNNFCKVTDETLALWRKVMEAVAGSRLVLLCPAGKHREGVIERLGVEREHVEFVEFADRGEYLQRYQGIDLALDTIPYNGHTTSLDALWMGVAVLSRVGRTVVGRAGVSQMFQLGLMEFVAETDEQFVETAVKWAADLEGLERLRASLRGKMEGSALMDGKRFARHIEAAFGRMWEEYVAGDSCQRGS